MTKLRTKDYAYIALMAAVMAVCAWISIPATVPFTLQTFGVFTAVGLLGGRRGTISVALYILLGLIGLPVFSGFSGGAGYLLGATGGYIIGFIFSALTMWAFEKSAAGRPGIFILSMITGLLVCYAFGTVWFMTVYAKSTGEVGLLTALSWCIFPYIIPDAAKIALAFIVCRRLRRFVV